MLPDIEPTKGSSFSARMVSEKDAPALARLFEASHSTCFCRYWHFDGDKNEWLDRSANHADTSRREHDEALSSRSPEATGIVAATPDGEVVGWLKLSPVASVTKMFQQRYYRSLPCFGGDRSGVHVVGCLLVHPAQRLRGVARALITEAVAVAERQGARAVEALPRRTNEPVTGEELWMGPLSVYRALGFIEVHRPEDTGHPDPYPVLRLELPKRDG